ncbi:MAG: hypothetical protein KGI04_04535 [Candidatus Micrarchaeota archaeon]|nr:hypothetical protein [Candidatus Micrarchaeota archaeon]
MAPTHMEVWRIHIDQNRDKDFDARLHAILLNRSHIQKDRASLIRKYGEGEYVAYFGGELIDHDRDVPALAKRLEANFPEKRKSMAVELLRDGP